MWVRQDAVYTKNWSIIGDKFVTIRTKYFPTFAETFPVLCVDDVDDGVAILIVSVPDIADATLTA